MPFTPFHLGPALLMGLPLRGRAHVPTLLLGGVVPDIEPLAILLLKLDLPLHWYLHSFLPAALAGLTLGYLTYLMEPALGKLYGRLLKPRELGLRSFLIAGTLGMLSHVVLDAPLYPEMRPLYPLPSNPFYDPSLSWGITSLCLISAILGLAYYAILLVRGSQQE
ncbi:MAG: hydrolase [Candidatus Korarchaeum sp.]